MRSAATTLDPPVGDSAFTLPGRRTGIVGRVLAAVPLAALALATLDVQISTAPWTAPFLGEQGF
jgi:hypothetical protein